MAWNNNSMHTYSTGNTKGIFKIKCVVSIPRLKCVHIIIDILHLFSPHDYFSLWPEDLLSIKLRNICAWNNTILYCLCLLWHLYDSWHTFFKQENSWFFLFEESVLGIKLIVLVVSKQDEFVPTNHCIIQTIENIYALELCGTVICLDYMNLLW